MRLKARIRHKRQGEICCIAAIASKTRTGPTQTKPLVCPWNQHYIEAGFHFVANGARFDGRQIVSEAFFHSHRTGDTITIRNWTRDPTLTEIEPGHRANQTLIGEVVATIAAGLTLLFATLGWRWASAARWMACNGVAQEVTVTRLAGLWSNVGTMTTILTDPTGQHPSLWAGDL